MIMVYNMFLPFMTHLLQVYEHFFLKTGSLSYFYKVVTRIFGIISEFMFIFSESNFKIFFVAICYATSGATNF